VIEAGRVVALWRYPMKSFLGERLQEAPLGAAGVVGDRGYALRDVGSGHVLSAKKFSMLLHANAELTDDGVLLSLPDGSSMSVDDPSAAAAVSSWLGREIEIVRAPGGTERATVEGDTRTFRSRPGGFFDSSAVHVVTMSTLAALARLHPAGRFDPRRFRPNVVLETPQDGFVEEGWVGSTLKLGDVELEITKTCARCVMTTHAQSDLPVDRDILRTVNAHNDEIVGVYGIVRRDGVVRVGDAAGLLE
jgi:MOSC domain-containing protein